MANDRRPAAPRSAPKAAAPAAAKRKTYVKVRATQDGYYGNKFRRAGDVFSIEAATAQDVANRVGATVKGDPNRLGYFSEKWMERVDDDAPERTSSSNEVLEKKRQESRRAQAGGLAPGAGPERGTGDVDVFGDEE